MGAQPQPAYLTPEEYLAGERLAETKSEYFAGEVYAFAGTTWEHATIVLNLGGELRQQLKGRKCQAVSNDLRVQVSPAGPYVYPDVVVVCGEPELLDDELDTLLNPTLIIEVLSESTEAHDRGWKLRHYQKLESVEEIILVAQTEVRVEQYLRQPGGLWLLWSSEDLDAVLRMPSIKCDVPLAEIYDKVEFPEPPALPEPDEVAAEVDA